MLKRVKLPVFWAICGGMFLLLLFSMLFAINVGAVDLRIDWIFQIILNKITGQEIFTPVWPAYMEGIVWGMRFPKVIVAVCVGGGLSLVGILMQALTKNALADPYILGISSGASTGATAVIMLGSLPLIGAIGVPAGAFIGAMASAIIVFILAGVGRSASSTKLVLSGTAVSACFSAVTNLLIFVSADTKKVSSALFWMTGSFSGIEWLDVIPVTASLLVAVVVVMIMNRTLDTMLLGEDMAITVGVNVRAVKIIIILISTLLTGVMVSVSGVIGFVGLVIPHISRTIVGTSHHRMVPFSLLLGGLFLVWADVLARVVASPSELPIGVVTALLGAPFFLFLLRKSKYSFSDK